MICTMSTDTAAAVRAGEELDQDKLSSSLQDKIEGGGELTIEQFPGGHSNLTYLLRTPVREYVLRRGSLGLRAPQTRVIAPAHGAPWTSLSLFAAAPAAFLPPDETPSTLP